MQCGERCSTIRAKRRFLLHDYRYPAGCSCPTSRRRDLFGLLLQILFRSLDIDHHCIQRVVPHNLRQSMEQSNSIWIVRQPCFQFIKHVMLRRRIDPLMPQRLLRLTNIRLGELHMHMGQDCELTRRGSSNHIGTVKATKEPATPVLASAATALTGAGGTGPARCPGVATGCPIAEWSFPSDLSRLVNGPLGAAC